MPLDRPVRAAFVGLGRICDLNVLAYRDDPDVDVVFLVDPDEARRHRRGAEWPDARRRSFCERKGRARYDYVVTGYVTGPMRGGPGMDGW